MHIELEVLEGLEPFAIRELEAAAGTEIAIAPSTHRGRIPLRQAPDWTTLQHLKSVVAAHQVVHFDIPRPRGFLGHANLTRLIDRCKAIISRHPPDSFETFRISAAGSDSAVFNRLRSEIAAALNLREVAERPNLLVSVRRAGTSGWEVLIRLTPRPLSARNWRVCNYEAALDATIAHAMAALTVPREGQRCLNLACGSGTLLIERLAMGPAAEAVGIDNDPLALGCARRNIEAAGLTGQIQLIERDAAATGLPGGSFDAVTADLPFGMAGDAQAGLATLYAGILEEATRLAAPAAAMTLVTTRRTLLQQTLDAAQDPWTLQRTYRVSVPAGRSYIHPTIFHLTRA